MSSVDRNAVIETNWHQPCDDPQNTAVAQMNVMMARTCRGRHRNVRAKRQQQPQEGGTVMADHNGSSAGQHCQPSTEPVVAPPPTTATTAAAV